MLFLLKLFQKIAEAETLPNSFQKAMITLIRKPDKDNPKKEMKGTIVRMNKTKTWFFEKTDKIDKRLARHIKKKREKNQINKIRNVKGEVTSNNAEIQRIIREYYEQLYGNKMDNLEEMDRFLEKFNLPRMNQ